MAKAKTAGGVRSGLKVGSRSTSSGQLLRIAFLVLLGIVGIMQAGCSRGAAITAQPTASATVTSTPQPTSTVRPTSTPQPTATPTTTPTPTEIPCDLHSGGQVTRDTLDSALLGYSYTVSVYTPPCYGREEGVKYPVLYLLHGQTADDTFWLGLGVAGVADQMIAEGKPPFLMVMPYEVDDFAYATDSKFGDSVLHELLPWVESHYNVCTERVCRAIGGISRGGGWAIRLVARNFDVFGALGAHSPGPMPLDWLYIQKPLETHTREEYMRIWIDRGTDDFLAEDIDDFVKVLIESDIPHEYHIWPGYHGPAYWGEHLADYLAWYVKGWQDMEK